MNTRYSPRLEQSEDSPIEPEFQQLFATIGNYLAPVADMLDVPPLEVTAVATNDYCGEVERTWIASDAIDESQSGNYTVDRVGGIAVAKTIPMAPDRSRFRIIFDRSQLGPFSDPAAHALAALLVAHELSHPLLDRLRWASGAMDGITLPSHTPVESARSITRIAVDEMRADVIANVILGQLATVTQEDGHVRPARLGDVVGDDQRISIGALLDEIIHPGWPDLVYAYRTWQVTLDQMWSTIATQTDQTVTMLAHVEAQATASERPGPLAAELANHQGTRLYLGPMWKRILDASEGARVPALANFRDAELALLDEGEKAITDMWKQLGLTFELLEGRSYHIHVTNPAR